MVIYVLVTMDRVSSLQDWKKALLKACLFLYSYWPKYHKVEARICMTMTRHLEFEAPSQLRAKRKRKRRWL